MYAFKQLYFGYSRAEKIWFSSISFTTLFIKGIARPFSFFQSPACFADYLIIGTIAIIMLASTGKFRTKMMLLPLVPIFFYGILITSVRSNWIGLAAVFFFWFVFMRLTKAWHKILVIASVVIVFFSYQYVADSVMKNLNFGNVAGVGQSSGRGNGYVDLLVTTRTGAITNPFEEHSLLSRVFLWKMIVSYSAMPNMALFGRGLGTLNADSLYFTYLAEFGYPGLLLILILVVGFVVRGIKTLPKLTDPRSIALVKATIVFDVVFALMNITGSHIHAFPGDAYFWFFNGVLLNVQTLDARLSSEQRVV
jgi:hypothetical protein